MTPIRSCIPESTLASLSIRARDREAPYPRKFGKLSIQRHRTSVRTDSPGGGKKKTNSFPLP